MNAAEWLRVSTGEQDTANQQPGITAAREQRGDDPAARFEVEASASQGHHRGQWAKLVTLVKQGRVRRVYVWSLDRVSREGIPAMFAALYPILKARGVVVSVQAPWLEVEPGSAQWEIMVSFTVYMARSEAERIKERTRAALDGGEDAEGHRISKRDGKRLGRPLGRRDDKPRKRRGDRKI